MYAPMSRVLVRGVLVLALLGLPSAVRAQDTRERLFWESVECDREAEVRVYLEVYPAGAYVAEAWACLEEQLGLDRGARILVQQGLASLDYAAGAADGLFGPATRTALRQWQRGKGFVATGYLTREQGRHADRAGTGRRGRSRGGTPAASARGGRARRSRAARRGRRTKRRMLRRSGWIRRQRTALTWRPTPLGATQTEARARQRAAGRGRAGGARRLAAREEAARRARAADEAAYAEAQRVDTAAAYGAYLTSLSYRAPCGRGANTSAGAKPRQNAWRSFPA